MIIISLVALLFMVTVHLPNQTSPLRAISWEIRDGNPIAYLLMASLCGVICIFARLLKQSGHTLRTVLLLLDVVGLIVIATTSPESSLHETALVLVTFMTLRWFAIMALDYGCHSVLVLLAISVPLLLMSAFVSIGLAEKGLILTCLVSGNLLYYDSLGDGNADRRLWN